MNDNKLEVINLKRQKISLNLIKINKADLNFNHEKYLIDNFDLIRKIEQLSHIKTNSFYLNNKIENIEDIERNINDKKINVISNVLNVKFKIIYYFILILIFIICLGVFSIMLVIIYKKYINKQTNIDLLVTKVSNNLDIEVNKSLLIDENKNEKSELINNDLLEIKIEQVTSKRLTDKELFEKYNSDI